MRRIVMATVAAPALAVPAVPASASARHHRQPSCPTGRGHVLLADSTAEVYRALDSTGLVEEVFGCVYGHHRSYSLGLYTPPSGPLCGGGGGGCGGIVNEQLNGSIVAFEVFSSQNEPGGEHTDEVAVLDLRNGRTVHRVPTGAGSPRVIVLKGDGAVAWSVQTGQTPPRYEVHALDNSGSRVLASGGDVEPFSLALASSTTYWTQAGKPFSATLN